MQKKGAGLLLQRRREGKGGLLWPVGRKKRKQQVRKKKMLNHWQRKRGLSCRSPVREKWGEKEKRNVLEGGKADLIHQGKRGKKKKKLIIMKR